MVALEGYCPVCIVEMKKWVKGSPAHQSVYDGRTYYFPGEAQRQKFLSDPAKYVPVLGGDCVVCYAKTGKRMPGSIRHGMFHKGRLYIFASEEQKQMFAADPGAYENVDLALGGNCAVCRGAMNQAVPGKPEFQAHHDGLRYLFPTAKHRDMFLADPEKYTVRPGEKAQSGTSPGGRLRPVSILGGSGCAGCQYGVHPLGAQGTLGLAIRAPTGKVYVVEDAHKLYPQIYENRFQGLKLALTGSALKEEGQFVWVAPQSLTVIQ